MTSIFNGVFDDTADEVTDGSSANTFAGIAVSADASNSSTQGVWQFSSNSGGDWDDIGTIAVGSSVLIDKDSLIRFLPVTNFSGAPGDLTVHAVDSSTTDSFSVSPGTVAVETFTMSGAGDPSAVTASDAGVALNTTISIVNDAPSFVSGNMLTTITEDATNPSGQSVNDLLGSSNFTDLNETTANNFSGIVVVSNAANATTEGSWQFFSSGSWADIGSVTTEGGVAIDKNSLIRFVPVTDFNGVPTSLTVYAVEDSITQSFSTSPTPTMVIFNTLTDNDTTSHVASSGVSLGIIVDAGNDDPNFTGKCRYYDS